MKTFPILSIAIVSLANVLIIPTTARAIALPDTNSPCSTSGPCLRITNTSSSIAALGISGFSSTGTGVGVAGHGVGGAGVYGYSLTSNGVSGETQSGNGVQGLAHSSGNGVYGYNDSGFGHGIYGLTTGTSFAGVFGNNSSGGGLGVLGAASGSGIGVYGDNSDSNGWAGYFRGNVFATGTYQGSDARLKKDINDIPIGVKQLLQLRAVSYKWKEGNDDGMQLGLIAQEVQKIVPEVVRTDAKSGMLSINYTALIPVLIKAVQEQQARITVLEKERPSVLTGGIGQGAALGLLPLGLLAAYRRRRSSLLDNKG